MASYFLLQLDTTPPLFEILAPNYTTPTAETEIEFLANEQLSSYQNIYIIDSIGNRHDITFVHQGNSYVATLVFNDYSLGIATIYAQLEDEVGNRSGLFSKSFNILETQAFVIDLTEVVAEINMDILSMDIDMEVLDHEQ